MGLGKGWSFDKELPSFDIHPGDKRKRVFYLKKQGKSLEGVSEPPVPQRERKEKRKVFNFFFFFFI